MNLDENALIRATDAGLFCERGGFFIDPWRPVDRAVVTHAHADHLCAGCSTYLIARDGLQVTQARLNSSSSIQTVEYGESYEINGVKLSLHPAGHILGSAQVRVEHNGRIWVVSGDYKTEADRSCARFEAIRCHVFISECTFGLPVYRWPSSGKLFADIFDWWQSNQAEGRASLLYAYALGKAQRILAGLMVLGGVKQGLPGLIYTHRAVETMTQAYRDAAVVLPSTTYVAEAGLGVNWSTTLVIAPPSAHGSPWSRRFGPASSAFASGWMRLRGMRRRRAVDRGFVLSDHIDWPSLLSTIDATGAETVLLTHGYTAVVARWLREQGKDAHILPTRYEGERDETADSTGSASESSLMT
jgi:putative mRNA 3-end processing factor